MNKYVNKIFDKYYKVSPIKKPEWSKLLNGSQIQQMFEKLYPWVDKSCSSSGWGWNKSGKNFTNTVFTSFNQIYNKKNCSILPSQALHMSYKQLLSYNKNCLSRFT